MNEFDKQMILDLAQRVKQALPVQKDPEAEELIRKEISSQPDSTYVLSQAVLVQKHALEHLHQQVQELQNQLIQQQMQTQQQPQQPSLLSRIFGGKANEQPSPIQQNQPYGSSPSPPYGSSPPPYASAPTYSPPPQGSSFLKSAMSTAAGVAGGMFLFQGLQNLFGGGHQTFANPTDTMGSINNNDFLNAGFGDGSDFSDSGTGGDGNFGDDGFGDGGDW